MEPGTAAPQIPPHEFVDRVLQDAVDAGASDLYWLPGPGEMELRRRVAGLDRHVARLPGDYAEQCVARLKVLASLLTYRRKIAQDGVIRRATGARATELRVAVMPTVHGERVTVRFANGGGPRRLLEDLGFPGPVVDALRGLVARPAGLVVLTGPTGSGKTTTIYAMLRELIRAGGDPSSIITIEDPIECEIPGISQTAVSSDRDWDYAAALRAALRQDVKTIVVGELRDRDVVRVTIDAALTGHRVITTYHAGDIATVYARLLHQGVEPFLIASAIAGVVTQRLVPAADGSRMVPLVGVLVADDAWRDFLAARPGLAELRGKLAERPGADLGEAARQLFADGVITEGAAAQAAGYQ